MKYCPKCGAETEDKSAFCPQCGSAFAVGSVPPPNPYSSDAHRQTPPPPYQNTYYPPPPNFYPPYGAPRPAADDAPSGGFGFLSFLWPLLGLILYLVWKDERPLRAKSCGKGALIGVILYVALTFVWIVIVVLAATVGYGFMDALTPAVSAIARLAG
jgi:hypothetical protein